MNKLILLLGLTLMLGACVQPAAPSPVVETPVVVAPNYSDLVGTWTGPWNGQSGLLEAQFGIVTLTVVSDGKVSCTITQNSMVGGVIPSSTSACSGSLVLNNGAQSSVAILLKYTYPGNPEVSATGSANYLGGTPKRIHGSLNNVVTGTVGNGQISGELGNLYFELNK